MRAWVVVGAAIVCSTIAWTLFRRRSDEEMFIRLGDRDLRSLPM